MLIRMGLRWMWVDPKDKGHHPDIEQTGFMFAELAACSWGMTCVFICCPDTMRTTPQNYILQLGLSLVMSATPTTFLSLIAPDMWTHDRQGRILLHIDLVAYCRCGSGFLFCYPCCLTWGCRSSHWQRRCWWASRHNSESCFITTRSPVPFPQAVPK